MLKTKDDHARATEPYRPSRATASLGYGGDLGRLRCDSGHGGRAARQLPDGAGARIARGDFVPAVVLGAQPQPRRRLHHGLAVPAFRVAPRLRYGLGGRPRRLGGAPPEPAWLAA